MKPKRVNCKTCSEVWITHAGGTWMIGVGDEIGRVMWSSSSTGKSLSVREPVAALMERHPSMKGIIDTLLSENAEQFNIPNAPVSESAGRKKTLE